VVLTYSIQGLNGSPATDCEKNLLNLGSWPQYSCLGVEPMRRLREAMADQNRSVDNITLPDQ